MYQESQMILIQLYPEITCCGVNFDGVVRDIGTVEELCDFRQRVLGLHYLRYDDDHDAHRVIEAAEQMSCDDGPHWVQVLAGREDIDHVTQEPDLEERPECDNIETWWLNVERWEDASLWESRDLMVKC